MFFQIIKNYYHLFQSLIANIRYGFPARNMKIIGVTGTDGKTTCASMIYHILKTNGFKVAMITTIYAKAGDEVINTGLHVTTPEPWQLPMFIAKFKAKGYDYLVLESTSQGLDQHRLFGITYDTSLITNIGQDHLDYHKTWENYANAKFKIIRKTAKHGQALINRDHESFDWLYKKIKPIRRSLCSIEAFSKSDVTKLEKTINGMQFEYRDQIFRTTLIGDYNLENCMGVIRLCERYLDLDKIAMALKSFEPPIGRMQVIQSSPFTIIVDFAHTPSSLDNALKAVINSKAEKSKIICVFGCAGERDKNRRKMGEVSTSLADVTLVTLEDPRSEKVKKINDDILAYAKKNNPKLVKRYTSHDEYAANAGQINDKLTTHGKEKMLFTFDYDDVQNRIDAIEFGIKLCGKGDILFITGKGHEQSLAIGNPAIEHEYTDQAIVGSLIRKSV